MTLRIGYETSGIFWEGLAYGPRKHGSSAASAARSSGIMSIKKKKNEAPMKKLTLLIVVASLFMVFPTIAAGMHFSDGNQLQEVCNEAIKLLDSKGNADVFTAGTCLGYLRATNDMYEIMAKDSKRTICIPPGISGKQLTRIVVKYLQEHPERLQSIASFLVFEAFQESFPYSKPEPPQ